MGLFIKQSIIFRSDSNSEDLEGYTYCAGLYDSVPMNQEELVSDADFADCVEFQPELQRLKL
jgi:hypothetical protein